MTAVTTNYKFKLTAFDVVTWHDAEHDNWRSVDALMGAFFAAPGLTGVWSNSTTYTVGQLAVDGVDGKVYEVLVGHTSAASPTLFSTDRATNSTYWEVWLISHAGDTNNPHLTPSDNNVIINGNFDIWQRGAGITGASGYTADRFSWVSNGAGVVDVLRSTSVPSAISDYSLQVDVTTGDAAIAAGDHYEIEYRVEGYDAMRFAFGVTNVRQLLLSFYVRSPKTGTHCVAFKNSANDRSYIIEYPVSVADTWEKKTVVVTADPSGTWLTDNNIGLRIVWALAAGSTFQGSAGGWLAGNLIATSNQVNCMDDAANDFHISQVKLESRVGGVATPFIQRSFAAELSLCQRYYQKTFPQAVAPTQNAGLAGAIAVVAVGTTTGQAVQGVWQYTVTMRGDPTIVTYNPSAANANWRNVDTPGDETVAVETTESNDRCAVIGTSTAVVDGDRHRIHAVANAELS